MTNYSCLDCKYLKGCLRVAGVTPAKTLSWQNQRYWKGEGENMTVKERLDDMVVMALTELKMKKTQECGTVTEGVYPMMTSDALPSDYATTNVQIFTPDIWAVAKEVGAEVINSEYGLYFFMYRGIAFFSYKGAV